MLFSELLSIVSIFRSLSQELSRKRQELINNASQFMILLKSEKYCQLMIIIWTLYSFDLKMLKHMLIKDLQKRTVESHSSTDSYLGCNVK